MFKRRIAQILTECRLIYNPAHFHLDIPKRIEHTCAFLELSSRSVSSRKPSSRILLQCLRPRSLHLSLTDRAIEIIKAPTYPDSVSTGDVRIVKKEGDPVAADEVVMEIETDKTALPVMSPGNGIIKKLFVKAGQAVKSQEPLLEIDVTGIAPAAAAPAAAPATTAAPTAPAAPAAPGAAAPPLPPASSRPVVAVQATPRPKLSEPVVKGQISRHEHPVAINKIRRRIAERLKEAQNTCAMVTTFNECDMSKLMEFRKENKDQFLKKYGVKLSFMSPFLKASANALDDQPVVNGVIIGNEVIYRDYVDISVAVATPGGLVVPVIRNVQTMDYPNIELALNNIAKRAKAGQLTPADMQGGTFTISNGGVFGSLLSMPIINLPQSAILGMHAILQRPVAVKGKIEIRPMMYLALTYDHRLIDGREAVLFLKKIKTGVEDPTTILAGV